MRTTLLFSLLILAGCSSIDNARNNQALARFNSGDCATAYQEWKELAYEKHNIYGINNLGLIYERGCPAADVPQDHKLAFELYHVAATGNLPIAINNVGASYENGMHVARDADEAIRLYKLAARYGDQMAIGNLKRLGLPSPPPDLVENNLQASAELFGEFLKIMAVAAGGVAKAYANQPPAARVRVQQTRCNSSGGYGAVYTNCTTY